MAVKSLSIRIDEEMLNKLHVLADYEGRSANSEILILIRDAIEEFEKAHGKIALWCCLELIYNISIVNKTFIPDNPSVSFHSTAPSSEGAKSCPFLYALGSNPRQREAIAFLFGKQNRRYIKLIKAFKEIYYSRYILFNTAGDAAFKVYGHNRVVNAQAQ